LFHSGIVLVALLLLLTDQASPPFNETLLHALLHSHNQSSWTLSLVSPLLVVLKWLRRSTLVLCQFW